MEYEYIQPTLFDEREEIDPEYERLLEYWAGALGISEDEARILIVRDLPEASQTS